MKANMDIRQTARSARVNLWEIAYGLDMQDSNFSRLLRLELSPEEKEKIFAIIEQLKAEREAG